VYSLKYNEIPKVFFTDVEISRATKEITNATILPKLLLQ
jgi:hypothetical protein